MQRLSSTPAQFLVGGVLIAGALAFGSAIAGGAGQTDYVRAHSTESDTTASNSKSPKSGQVLCPEGKRAISGGASINGATDDGVVVGSIGPSGARGWEATAFERSSVGKDWSLTVTVSCADTAGDPEQSDTSDAGPAGPKGEKGPPGEDAQPPPI